VGAQAVVLGDNGKLILSNAGVLLSAQSQSFASGAADTITLTSGTNAVIGGAGADDITAGGGTNTVLGDDGEAFFFANGHIRLIQSINLGSGANDTIELQDGTNTVIAGSGADTLTMGGGTNYVLGDEGKLEVLTDGSGNPTGTTEVQSLNASVGDIETISVGSGYNVVIGGAASDEITVNGTTVGASSVVLGDNGKLVFSNSGILLSAESTDFASGAADTITLTSGTNAVIGGAGADEITAGGGTNTVLGDDGEAFFFANGDIRLIQSINLGNGANDTIELQDGTNTVIAGAGADTLTMGGGTNYVLGDEGKLEVLTDGSGNPTGTTEVQSLNAAVGGIETINIGSGYNVVIGGAAGDAITVNGTTAGASSVVLGDNGRLVLGNSGTLLSAESTDFASGAADTITLTSGTNAVIGGAGADGITAGGGTNTVLGDDGKATFFSDGSIRTIESINPGSGANDNIQLQDGTNTVIAGAGSDILSLGAGTNYVLADEGKLEVQTSVAGIPTGTTEVQSLNAGVGGTDTVNVGSGYNVIVGGADSDSITVNGTTANARGIVLGDNGLLTLSNAGKLLSIESNNFASGSADTITLTNGTNAVIGGAGNDQITAGEGSNTILGDDGKATFFTNGDLQLIESINLGNGGNDVIGLQNGVNVVIGGAGADSITAGAGENTVLGDEGQAGFFADGSVRLIESTNLGVGGIDTIELQDGTNSVIAGAAADNLTLGGGRNFVLGDEGRYEVLTNGSGNPTGTTIISSLNGNVGGTDTIGVGVGYNVVAGGAGSDSVTVNGSNADARGIIVGDNARMTLSNTGTLLSVESIDYSGGAADTINLTAGVNTILGGAGADLITASTGRNTVLGDDGEASFFANGDLRLIATTNSGNGGGDVITLQNGINVVIAGAGADVLSLGAGSNYVLADEGRLEVLTNGSGNPTGVTGVSSQNASVGSGDQVTVGSGYNVVVGGAASDSIVVNGTTANARGIVLGDSGSMRLSNAGDLLSIDSTNFASGAGDTITLTNGTNTVIGGAGADQITAGNGTNTILGDDGKASFFANGDLRLIESINLGVGGDDTITLSDGVNSVIAGAGHDTISLGAGRNFVLADEGRREVLTDSSGTPTGTTVVSSLNGYFGGMDTVSVGAGYNVVAGGAKSDNITVNGTTAEARGIVLGDNGTITLANTGELLEVVSTQFAAGASDTITLTNGTNTVIAGAGSDQITANDGENVVVGDDGRVAFFSNGDLRLIESINPGAGSGDTITLNDGVNRVIAGAGNDRISLGAGRNFVLADEGRLEVLTNGGGAPTGTTVVSSLNGLVGGTDTVTVGSGYNVVAGGANSDTITVNGATAASRGIVLGDNAILTFANTGELQKVESTQYSGGAADAIRLVQGENTVIGGAGGDVISVSAGNNAVVGDDGEAIFQANGDLRVIESTNSGVGGNDTLTATTGINTFIGGAGADAITMANGRNVVLGDEGRAWYFGASEPRAAETTNSGVGGNDVIRVQNGLSYVIAGAGADNVALTGGKVVGVGDEGTLNISVDADGLAIGDAVLQTRNLTVAGNDVVTLGNGNHIFAGGSGSDNITINPIVLPARATVLGDNGEITTTNFGSESSVVSQSFTIGDSDQITIASGTNTVIAGTGNDTVTITGGNNTVLGDNGQSVVSRAGGIVSSRFVETLNDAGGGNDTVTASGGINVVIAGAGRDSVTGTNPVSGVAPKFYVLGDSGRANLGDADQLQQIFTKSPMTGSADTITLASGNDLIFGGDGNDVITAGNGNNIVLGDHGDASLDENGTVRFIYTIDTLDGIIVVLPPEEDGDGGGGGPAPDPVTYNDTITSGSGDDLIIGGSGSDSVTDVGGRNLVLGDSGIAIISANGRIGELSSLAASDGGIDVISTASGIDTIFGGSLDDQITDAGGANVILGDNGHALFDGSGVLMSVNTSDHDFGGADVIITGTSNDILIGGSFADRITSTGGNNLVLGDNGEITFDALGRLVRAQTQDVVNFGDDTVTLNGGNDIVLGGSGKDRIDVSNGNNVVMGDNGFATFNTARALTEFDTTEADQGDRDTIMVGTGDDVVIGGTAADYIRAIGGSNLIVGDNARIQSDMYGRLQSVATKDPLISGTDQILSGAGNDIILGGSAGDSISDSGGRNIVVGDNAIATFDTARQLRTVTSTDPTSGGVDRITMNGGDDIVLAGSAGDIVNAGDGNNIVLGDHGTLTLDNLGRPMTLTTTNSSIGGNDLLSSGSGQDIVLAGFGNDSVSVAGGNNIVVGDNGQVTWLAGGVLQKVNTLDAAIGGVDNITTGAGEDIIIGGTAADTIAAAGGNNIVIGDSGCAIFNSARKVTSLTSTDPGVGGNDVITSDLGNDVVIGGFGNDQINVTGGNNVVLGDNGSATFNASGAILTLTTANPSIGGADSVTTGAGNDVVLGGAGRDILTAGDGRNVLLGDHGNIRFDASGQWLNVNSSESTQGDADRISSGIGIDLILGGTAGDTIDAGTGDNVITGDSAVATLNVGGYLLTLTSLNNADGGVDTIRSGAGNDLVIGGTAGDSINAGDGSNVVLGDGGRATFSAVGKLATLRSQDTSIGGQDRITTGVGRDIVFAGADADIIAAGNGDNTIVGDNASAVFDVDANMLSLTTINAVDGGNDTITTGTGRDVVFGGSAQDSISISSGNNLVLGDNGKATFDTAGQWLTVESLDTSIGDNDTVTTSIGNDVVFGGTLHDQINVSGGRNIVVGDSARATFDSTGAIRTLQTIAPAVGGNDVIVSGTGNDVVFGGMSNDNLTASGGNNVIVGDNAIALNRVFVGAQPIVLNANVTPIEAPVEVMAALLTASISAVLAAVMSTFPVFVPVVLVTIWLDFAYASELLSTVFVAITPFAAKLKPDPNALPPLDVAVASAVAFTVAFSVAETVTSPADTLTFSRYAFAPERRSLRTIMPPTTTEFESVMLTP
jgi:Ca2+-binding RTX toxin-like protein